MIAAILIAATAAAEAANGPDSNYETGLMSVILIGLTAVPAVLTAFWTGRWWLKQRACCEREAGGKEDAMQEEAAVETEAAGTEDGQEGVGLSSDEKEKVPRAVLQQPNELSSDRGSAEKETVEQLEEENKQLKVGVTDGELVISELMEENAALKAENAAQADTIAAEAAAVARLEKELELAWAPSVFWSA